VWWLRFGGIFKRSLRATTKKGRQLFWQKVHPQTKSWLHLWFLCSEGRHLSFPTPDIIAYITGLVYLVLPTCDTEFKTAISNAHCVECPADFTYISAVNGCYKLITRNILWSVAGLECHGLHKGAHLLIINDAQEQLAVTGMLASTDRQYYFVFFTINVAIRRNELWFIVL